MKRIISITLLIIAISTICYSQNNEKTLKIIGKAKQVITPDMVNFTFNFSVKDKNQFEVQLKLTNETNKLVDFLLSLNYNKNEIKLSSFSISEDYDYDNDKPKKIGYEASSQIEIAVKFDALKISNFIDTLGKQSFKYMSYNFANEISEKLKNITRDSLIQHAIENAISNANTIAKHAKIELAGIQSILYNDYVFNYNLESPMNINPPNIKNSQYIDFKIYNLTLKESEVFEEVTIIWEIKNKP